jgi:hypothetical protein
LILAILFLLKREKLPEKLLTAKDSTVVVDARHLKHTPGKREWNKLLLSAKFFAERLRRYGRKTITIKLMLPEVMLTYYFIFHIVNF